MGIRVAGNMHEIQQYGYDVPGMSKKTTKGNTTFEVHQAVAPLYYGGP